MKISYVEDIEQFAKRKKDHIDHSLDMASQASASSDFDQLDLISDSMPDLDFDQIDLKVSNFKAEKVSSFYVAAMTAGHKEAGGINHRLAKACSEMNWDMMIGSQRRELFDDRAFEEWQSIRSEFPNIRLIGNIGISQINELSDEKIETLIHSTGGYALAIHCNPLQEAVQEEGTRNFKNGLSRLKEITENFSTPIVLKETGSGFSKRTLEKVKDLKLAAIDVSGLGGTHWGRIEGMRAKEGSTANLTAKAFANFGVPTLRSIQNAVDCNVKAEIWASGGVRNGLHAAKCISLGATRVGTAGGVLKAANSSYEEVIQVMKTYEYQLRVALFCTESKNVSELKGKYQWIKN
ncbi:MAG: type 2 isopentenyl-diphosphate Delta-isomerase [Bdellovibrionota bacterium]|nr:type 2 isopentenyl-diphosphate Delta-isomerase [Bdellovibrionota bacterium]